MSETSPDAPFLILLYHGVVRETPPGIRNASGKHLPEAEFERQIQMLAREYVPMPLEEILFKSRQGSLPKRAVAVTFDDGFENNCTVAFPILERHRVPATFFLSTGLIGTSRRFWVDQLEFLLDQTDRPEMHLKSVARRYGLRTAAERREALANLKKILKTDSRRVTEVLEELEETAGVPADSPAQGEHLAMTWDQARRMRRSGLCSFGAHTADHTILSHLSGSEKQRQIALSKAALERELGEPVRLFAYPEGQSAHFDEESVRLVREAGFSAAVTALFGTNDRNSSPFHLRRAMVGMPWSFEQCVGSLDGSPETIGSVK